MKNFFKSLAICALAALTFASCQKENADGNMDDQSSVVSINLTSPLMGTKAFADGNTVNVVHVHVYQHDANGNLTYIAPATQGAAIETPSKDVAMSAGAARYSTRLVTGQTYTFVFWADYIDNNGNSHYTYYPDTKTIAVNYDNAAGNDETRDAFYAVLPGVTITGAYSQSVELKRPFAQVNFGVTTEDKTAAEHAGFIVSKAAVKCTNVGNQLNLLDGTVSGSEDVAFASAALPSETLSAANKTYKYVAMNYVLVGKDASTLSNITLTLEANDPDSATPKYTYTNIPLQGNYRTNIVGNLFTSPASINITVDSRFDGNNNNEVIQSVASVAAANEAFANGATNVSISVAENRDPETIVLPNTIKSVTLTIENYPTDRDLTINYSSVDGAAKPASLIVTAPNAQNITINCPETHVEVNGVTATSITASTSDNTLVIGRDVTVGTLTIVAGAVEIYGEVGTLTKGTNAGDVKVWAVGDEETWNKAYNAGAKTIILKNSFEITNTINIGRNLDIKGNGFEISHGTGSSAADSRIINITENPNLVLNFYNTKFTENATGAYSRGINIWGEASGSKIVLEGCTVSAGYYALNFIVGPQNIEFTIKNGTVAAGWAAINCYANNSTFNVENSTLKGLNDKGESSWNDFATIVFDGNGLWEAENIGVNGTGNTLNIVNSTIYASSESSNNQAWIALQYGAQRNSVKVDAATRIIDGSENDQTNNIAILNYVGYDSETETATLYDLESEIWIGSNNLFPGMYEQNGVYHIVSRDGLLYFAEKVNKYNNKLSGKTVLLDSDLDMSGIDFTPIGKTVANYPGYSFAGVFDGQDHTISNLKASSNDPNHAAAGLFGTLLGTVKNVNLTNVEITSTHYAGGVAGYLGSNTGAKVLNCTVNGGTITSTPELIGDKYDNGDKVGGIAGFIVYGETIDGCSVSNVTLKGYRDIGGILGCAANNKGVTTVTNCTVGENLKIVIDKEHNYKGYESESEHNANNIIGRTTGTATLNTDGSTGSVTIEY